MADRMRTLFALSAVAALGLAACSSSADEEGESGDAVVVATTNFSETKIIASMYEQVLEANGVAASIKELTTREVIAPALADGEVDITPEYLGSLTEFLNKQANGADAPQVASGDVDATFAAAQELAEPQGITLLEPSQAQDQNAFAVTEEFATANNLVSLSDLGAYSQGSPVRLGGPPECPERPFCQPGLEQVYGVSVESFKPLDAGGPLTVQDLLNGGIDVGLVFSSAGNVTANNLVVLEDDQELQTAENITPAVHTASLTDPIRQALDGVSAALTTEDLQRMNEQVDVERQNPDDVAEQFLIDNGLL
jgi:osmoprotectant transport system substrate-binding protein